MAANQAVFPATGVWTLVSGTATITEVDEAKARLDLATAQTIAARSDLEVKTHALRELTGLEFADVRRLRARIPYTRPQPESIAAWERDKKPAAVAEAAAARRETRHR